MAAFDSTRVPPTLTAFRVPGLLRDCLSYIEIDIALLFRQACCDGDLAGAAWLWGLGFIASLETHNKTFYSICKSEHQGLAPWFWHLYLKNVIPRPESGALAVACRRGDLALAQWLWSLSLDMDEIRDRDNYLFRFACYFGHINIAKWLWGLGLTIDDTRCSSCWALRNACFNSHFEVVQWLWGLESETARPYMYTSMVQQYYPALIVLSIE